jgi:uncharacterized protein YdaU (DUF1376 family)
MEHFINQGYGWTCRRCQSEETARVSERSARARFFSEGEAEEREPKLSASTWPAGATNLTECSSALAAVSKRR